MESQVSDTEARSDDMMVENYRPVSAIGAIVLVICVLFCLLAVINPNLTFLPLMGVFVASAWLIRLHFARMNSGRMLTAAALFVAIATFSGTNTYKNLRHAYLSRTAEQYAQQWLDMVVEGKVYEPYQLMQTILEREAEGTDLRAVLGDYQGGGASPIKLYAKVEPEVTIRELGNEGAEYTSSGAAVYYRKPHRREEFDVMFKMDRLVPGPGENDGDRVFAIRMHRQHCLPPWNVQWHGATVTNIEPEIRRQSGGALRGIIE